MQYSQYLYFVPRYLNEQNLYVLNEMYFGKTPRIKALEKLCQLYIDSFKKTITEKDLEPFYKILNKAEKKFLFKNQTLNQVNSFTRAPWISEMQNKILSLIADLISIIFGIESVSIVFDPKYDKYNNMAINHTFSSPWNISYNQSKNNKLHIYDAHYNFLDYDYIKRNIIVKNSGIALDIVKCPLKVNLFFSKQMHLEQTAEEIVSTILHEIGHFFSHLILPINKYLFENFTMHKKNKYLAYKEIDKALKMIKDNKDLFAITSDELDEIENLSELNKIKALSKIAGRVNEKFADQFVSLYGYGPHLSSDFLNYINFYGTSKNSGYLKQKENFTDNINRNSNFKDIASKSNIDSIDNHPIHANRIESQILQLQSELNNPRLSLYKKKQIEEDIQNIRQQLHNYNKSTGRYSQILTVHDQALLDKIMYDKFLKQIENLENKRDQCKHEKIDLTQRINNLEIDIKSAEETIKNLQKIDINNPNDKDKKYIKIARNMNKSAKTDQEAIDRVINIQRTFLKGYNKEVNENEQKIKKLDIEINNYNEEIKKIEDEANAFLSDTEKFMLEIRKLKKFEIRKMKKKDTKNYMYEKDSYIDPYDISTEINKLYDNTKLRHLNTMFGNDTWLSIKAQKMFEEMLNNYLKTSKISHNKIMDFIEEKYKYHMEKPFFKHNKIQAEIIKIFAQEKREIEQALSTFTKINKNLNNNIQLAKLLEVVETDNLNKNIKQLKRVIFGKKNN